MERQLGERFTYRGGVTLEVAEVEDEEMACKGCYLLKKALLHGRPRPAMYRRHAE